MNEEEWENDDLHPEIDYCKSMQEDSKNEMIDEYLRSNRQDDEFETEMGINSHTIKIEIKEKEEIYLIDRLLHARKMN